MTDKIKKLTALIISGITVLFFFLFLVLNPAKYTDKEVYSSNENRYLENVKKFNMENLKDGSYTESLQKWFCDFFPLRDGFMNVRSVFELGLGKTEINNVYMAKDGFLINKPEEFKNLNHFTDIINDLNNNIDSANLSLMLVPTAVTVYNDKLPKYADMGEELENIDRVYSKVNCNVIDADKAIRSVRDDKDDLYYKMDHHWTTKGAYQAYLAYCKEKNIKPVKEGSFKKRTVTNDFKGTIYSKVNLYGRKGEDMEVWILPKTQVSAYYPDIKKTYSSLYEPSYLNEKDKYSYFLNNIHPFVEITNDNFTGTDELVVIKDSYANCLIPFLANHYKKIYVIDPRYYKDSASQFINSHLKVSDVLVLYNMSTIASDNGIEGIN